jgi:hypothetical protein
MEQKEQYLKSISYKINLFHYVPFCSILFQCSNVPRSFLCLQTKFFYFFSLKIPHIWGAESIYINGEIHNKQVKSLKYWAAERFGNASLSYAPRRLVRQRLPFLSSSKLFKMPNQKRERFNACATCQLDCPFKMLSFEQREVTCHVYAVRRLIAQGRISRLRYRPYLGTHCLN